MNLVSLAIKYAGKFILANISVIGSHVNPVLNLFLEQIHSYRKREKYHEQSFIPLRKLKISYESKKSKNNEMPSKGPGDFQPGDKFPAVVDNLPLWMTGEFPVNPSRF